MLKLKKESFHMEHAGFWKRLVAIIIDTLVLVLFNFLLGFSLVFCAILLGIDEESLRSQGIQLGFEFIGVIIQTCYFILMESSSIQATLGKLAMGIFVRMAFVAPQDRCLRISVGIPEDIEHFSKAFPIALERARN